MASSVPTEMQILFPDNYPDSAAVADQEAVEDAQIADEIALENHIARNYGDCGVSKHVGLDEPDLYGRPPNF